MCITYKCQTQASEPHSAYITPVSISQHGTDTTMTHNKRLHETAKRDGVTLTQHKNTRDSQQPVLTSPTYQ